MEIVNLLLHFQQEMYTRTFQQTVKSVQFGTILKFDEQNKFLIAQGKSYEYLFILHKAQLFHGLTTEIVPVFS